MGSADEILRLGDPIRPLKRAEYDRLIDLGAFEDEKIELLCGVLVAMTPQGEAHALALERLSLLLFPLAQRGRARLRMQSPFAASEDSEPEPDLFLFPANSPGGKPERAHLIVEVAFSSQRKDRVVKSAIYAEAGVPEYWLVDLRTDQVEVRTNPRDGTYATIRIARPGDVIQLVELPDVTVAVSDFLR